VKSILLHFGGDGVVYIACLTVWENEVMPEKYRLMMDYE
jgi:hypothetical protein